MKWRPERKQANDSGAGTFHRPGRLPGNQWRTWDYSSYKVEEGIQKGIGNEGLR